MNAEICLIVDSSALPSSANYGPRSACCKKGNCEELVQAWLHLLSFLLNSCKGCLAVPGEVADEFERGVERVSRSYLLPSPPLKQKVFYCYPPSSTVKSVMSKCKLKEKDAQYVAALLEVENCMEYHFIRYKEVALVTCDSQVCGCDAGEFILSVDEVIEKLSLSLNP